MAINRFLHFLILKILDDSQTFKVSFQLSLYVFVLIHLQGFLSLGGRVFILGYLFVFSFGERVAKLHRSYLLSAPKLIVAVLCPLTFELVKRKLFQNTMCMVST